MSVFYISNSIKNNNSNCNCNNKSYTKNNHKSINSKEKKYLFKLLEKNNKIGFTNLLDFNTHHKSPNFNLKILNFKSQNKFKISLTKYDNSPNRTINTNKKHAKKIIDNTIFSKTISNYKTLSFSKKESINYYTERNNSKNDKNLTDHFNKKILSLNDNPLTILPYKENPTNIENQKHRARKIYSMFHDFYIHDSINYLSDRGLNKTTLSDKNNLKNTRSKMYKSLWLNRKNNNSLLPSNNLFKEKSKMDSFIKGLPNIIKRYYKFKDSDI